MFPNDRHSVFLHDLKIEYLVIFKMINKKEVQIFSDTLASLFYLESRFLFISCIQQIINVDNTFILF